ncbi:MAG: glycosyltransferase family 4 protein [Anaerolineae bacterium]
MRILHIIPRYWPARGGAEQHLQEISIRLVDEGHSVTVVTTDALDFELFWDPRRRRIEQEEAIHRGVRVRYFPVCHLPSAPLAYPAARRVLWLLSRLPVAPVGLLERLSRWTPRVPALWRWLASTDEPFDLVAAMGVIFEPMAAAGLRFARRRGIPFVVYPLTHLGAGPRPGDDPVSRFYTMRHQIALAQAANAVVAQTPTERAFYLKRGVAEERIRVIGPGVNPAEVLGGDPERFRRRHRVNGPLVVFLGHLSYDKGAIHVVEAVRALWRTGRLVELVMAGGMLTPFRRYLDRLPSSDRGRILILPSIEEDEKRDMLAACDLLALPSRTDSFGIVYLEAWLYRKPVIGARTWGIGDVIADGEDGLLVPFGDIEALARAIAFLLEHPEIRARMGAAGEAKVYRLHTWDRKYPQIRALYQHLIQRQG